MHNFDTFRRKSGYQYKILEVPPNRYYVRFYQEVVSIHLITSVIFAEDGHGSIPVWDIIHCILTQNGFLMFQKWQFVTECLSGDKKQHSELKFRIFLAVDSITSVLFFFEKKKLIITLHIQPDRESDSSGIWRVIFHFDVIHPAVVWHWYWHIRILPSNTTKF